VRDGDDYVVNGQKVWTSGGQYAEWGILMARTDPDAPKHRGISFFALDMATPGVTVRPLRQMTGAAEFNQVFLDDVRIPAENLIGPENEGWRVAMITLSFERGSIGGAAASFRRAVDALAALARETGASTHSVSRDAVTQRWVETETLRLTARRVVSTLVSGGQPGPEASILKLAGTESSFATAVTGSALHGA